MYTVHVCVCVFVGGRWKKAEKHGSFRLTQLKENDTKHRLCVRVVPMNMTTHGGSPLMHAYV